LLVSTHADLKGRGGLTPLNHDNIVCDIGCDLHSPV
jgi:hypothetical protein